MHIWIANGGTDYFETYPYLGVKLTNGTDLARSRRFDRHEEELAIPSDSLLAFNRATLSLQPLDYLFGSKITIKDFSIENPRFYGFVNKNGRANWDIYESETDSTETDAGKSPAAYRPAKGTHLRRTFHV